MLAPRKTCGYVGGFKRPHRGSNSRYIVSMKFKVIFLDIDGVLNSTKWAISLDGEFNHPINQVDPAAVARLNRITDATGAKIVVSSAWRRVFQIQAADPLLSLQGCLKTYGVTGEVIDMTPYKPNCVRNRRGKEIEEWVNENYSVIEKFVVIDDSIDDIGKMKKHLVRTILEDGLTDPITDQIISILGKKDGSA